ncbi:DDT domain-containing protein PTM-like [Humulus lupulus]|uniref:DDT domain-containing protein PTM-like n=1 Tax=Humulus lupulus TaxID=3486 RepID=UPI002B40EA4A|nr:DDT domain-containing protein PTM-like [Humulus lupulus]XP_062105256.1 DDT domain-containing protein PTM-like [Humulus lupulus]
MEPPVVKKRGRPRKRKREEDENSGADAKRLAVETKPIALLGRYMMKEFEDNGIFLGKVVYYADGLYRVHYEDGDCEDLESREIRGRILNDNDFNSKLNTRRKKLDELILRSRVKHGVDVESKKEEDKVEASTTIDLPGGTVTENDEGEVDGDDDSSNDSSEYAKDRDLSIEDEVPAVPPPELPPSSGTIGVPEQYVSHLFSVYGFLRSFSICLFLSPFTLDDFVGSLKCRVPNTLLDAIHVSLMRALRRHLDRLSEDGSELASKCLRCIDWSLLDTLTWPVFLVQYLTIMGYTKGPEWKGFYDEVLGREYYSLSVGRKLLILQVLCDDVLDSAELRAEIDLREESEVGIDYDAEAVNPPENKPKRVHPRYSKTSAYKNRESIGIFGATQMSSTPSKLNCRGPKGKNGDLDAVDMDVDRNSDECRLCGMDGTLLCCDGCPSAYHTRCIGVMKLSIPEGSWYCPECTINKLGPTITFGTSLRGAETFGIDSYGQIFLGTCNYLLVLKASVIEEPCLRYYNREDIPKVLQVLCTSTQHESLYLGVCQAVLQYWDIPSSILSLSERTIRDANLSNLKEDSNCPTLSLPPPHKDIRSDTASLDQSWVDNETSIIYPVQVGFSGTQISGDTKQLEYPLMNMKLPEGNGLTSLVRQRADPSDTTSQNLVERSLYAYSSENSNCSYTEHAKGSNCPLNLSSQRKDGRTVALGKDLHNSNNDCVFMGHLYKPQSYLNHYMHGDFAASAAAKLATLLPEDPRHSEAHASDNSKKASSENYLQAKAFSLTASRFFWPTSEKKLVEVPRERCGWCLSCKASVSSKRGCMLNHAALSATKGAMKTLASLRSIKSGEGILASIATYILYMEESLCGLLLGPYLNTNYRREWRKQVEQASTCSELKTLLLQLEENIRIIALSSDWDKLVDDWLVEYSAVQNAMPTAGATQKRGPVGKRNKKQAAMSELTTDGSREKSFVWWQGGKQSKLVFQKAILPLSMVRRAARQGGSRKISGICYTDGPEIPKRNRQLVWRAAVEMSTNASQLALQVRYLDLHVRWNDLVHPELNILDGKNVETEASAFRNAVICSKKVVESKVTYGVAFGHQKHLPSRVMKSIIEIEKSQDGEDKYWFSEIRVPLYLIKQYEVSVNERSLPSVQEPFNLLTKLKRQQLKRTHRDIFFYLTCKRDNLEIYSCISCHRDVVAQTAVKCSICKGSCHSDCTITSSFHMNEDVTFSTMCKQCHGKNATCNESPTSPFHLEVAVYQKLMAANKGSRARDTRTELKQVASESTSTAKKASKLSSVAKKPPSKSTSAAKKTSSKSTSVAKSRPKLGSWGIIWKKANSDACVDTSVSFRQNNILLKNGSVSHRKEPVCSICRKPYRPDLTYVCCETCQKWYHAEALQFDESRLFDVAGFKCCKCRRIKSPKCPYTPPKEGANSDPSEAATPTPMTRPRVPKIRFTLKRESSGVDSDSGAILNFNQSEPSTPLFPVEEVSQHNDPLLRPLTTDAQLITEPKLKVDTEWDSTGKAVPHKLPVRRQVKHEGDSEVYSDGNFSDAEAFTHYQMENPTEATDGTLFPSTEWNASVQSIEEEMMFDDVLDYGNLDFEPQTLFTFSELLGVDASGDDPEGQGKVVGTNPPDKVPEQYTTTNTSKEGSEPTLPPGKCNFCMQSEPYPDLSCQSCGLSIHRHCLTSTEPSSWDGDWKLCYCQEWR